MAPKWDDLGELWLPFAWRKVRRCEFHFQGARESQGTNSVGHACGYGERGGFALNGGLLECEVGHL